MIKINIIATGSKGNAYAISDGAERILIDPGIGIKEIQKALNFGVSDLKFCLLSHEHKDHSKSIKDILKYGATCYMSHGTGAALNLDPGAIKILKSGAAVKDGAWSILPFNVHHDAAEPLGFLIESPSGKKIVFATDTAYLSFVFNGVTHWMIECNYSEDCLKINEALPNEVKNRIRQSHFEFSRVKDFFRAMDLSKTEAIYLIHLSDDNSDTKRYVAEIEALTGKPVYAAK